MQNREMHLLKRLGAFADWRKIGFALLLLSTLLSRFHQLQHTLWYDEAWLANSVLEASWKDVFFYPAWLQTTPPGFLVLLRGTVKVLGTANWAFHLLPYLLGVAGVGIMTYLVSREFSAKRALWIGLLACGSASMVAFSMETKQYSAEFLVSALLILYLLSWRRIPGRFLRWGTPFLFGLAFFFAFPSIFFLPAALLLLLVESYLGSEELRMKPAHAAGWALYWAAASGVLCALTYFTFLVPNRDENLKQFWSMCYLTPNDSASFFPIVYMNLSSVLVQGLDSTFSGNLFVRFSTGSYVLALVLPLAAFLGLQNRGKAGFRLACVTVVPTVSALVASMLSLYPLCEVRFAQALLPCVLLMHALALDLVPDWPPVRRAGSMFLALLVLGLAISSMNASFWPSRVQTSFEDAFQFMRSQRNAAEPLFVHGALQEQFKLYSRADLSQRSNALQSITNPACCPRGMEYSQNWMNPTPFRDELARMLARAGAGRLWMMYADQSPQMKIPFREEPMHLRAFAALGCQKDIVRQYRDLSVYRFSCPAETVSRFAAMSWPGEPNRDDGGF